jgi:hypothetical protein
VGPFGRGFLASCGAAGIAVLVTCIASDWWKHGFLKLGSTFWDFAGLAVGFAVLIAIPATLVGWLCVRQLPARLLNAASIVVLGGLLGLAPMLAIVLFSQRPHHAWNSSDTRAAMFYFVIGAVSASASWWAGFRSEVRDH